MNRLSHFKNKLSMTLAPSLLPFPTMVPFPLAPPALYPFTNLSQLLFEKIYAVNVTTCPFPQSCLCDLWLPTWLITPMSCALLSPDVPFTSLASSSLALYCPDPTPQM